MALSQTEIQEYRPGNGLPIPGIVSGGDPQHRFLANVPVAQLLQIAPDPRLAENPKYHFVDPRLSSLHDLRLQIQRVFEAAKKRNVVAYAAYLTELATKPGFRGDVPPIKLYWPDPLTVARSAGQHVLELPYGAGLVAYDGETQLAGWHEAARTAAAVQGHYVDITIAHGLPTEWAKQAFHDMNVFGIKPNPTLSIFMDYRDEMNTIAKELATEFFPDKVEEQRRQASVRSSKIFTMAALRLFVVCHAWGTRGVANATRPMPYDGDVEALRLSATRWMQALVEGLPGEGLFSRQSIFTAPPMLAALGAMGKDGRAVEELNGVEWRRDAHLATGELVWEGVAGKQGRGDSPSLAVGGPKEYVHSCYRALTQADQPEYARVRSGDQGYCD